MIKKIRLLQVIPSMGIGGAETGCKYLGNYVAKRSEFSAILTSGGSQLNFLSKDVRIFKRSLSKNIFTILFNIFYIYKIIKQNNINIVHARSRAPAWSCYFACKLSKTKFVTTFHGTYNFNSSLKKFYNSIMIKSDLVIAGSNFIEKHIKSNYVFKNSLQVIKRGIDTSYFDSTTISQNEKDNLRKQVGFSNKNFLVLLPGRLTEWKGQSIFIEAANYLKKNNQLSNIFFIILGGSKGKEKYQKRLNDLVYSYKLVDKVRFLNSTNNMPLSYAFVNLVVSTSVEPEAFGRVSVEAQAMQKPVLASDLGGSKETIINKKTGWLIEPGNSEQLAKKILDISKMDNSILLSIGFQGRENVLENYTKDQMCLKTLEIYESLVY